MTRAEVQQKVEEMKVARLRGLEAETVEEEREFANVWHRLWREVQPYIEGRKSFSDEREMEAA
jgi:hypothetical protein